ncbi:hypothetical protein CHH57_02035 [Niallia circulans]|uniref:Uncharacterized protein n=1 Tax=Niallia circulans TaxID=1397 RepID=A0AA91TVS7_NIACI|nr:hypothetical protein CHH57_02035 [Niallia circulans]
MIYLLYLSLIIISILTGSYEGEVNKFNDTFNTNINNWDLFFIGLIFAIIFQSFRDLENKLKLIEEKLNKNK